MQKKFMIKMDWFKLMFIEKKKNGLIFKYTSKNCYKLDMNIKKH